MSDSATSTISNPTATQLPVASIPAVVLPGAVVTLTLGSDELRAAVTAARRTNDARVLLHTGSGEIAVIAQVPDVGSLPSGDPVAVIRIEGRARVGALHHTERGATYADAEVVVDPRPTPRVEALGRELRGVLGVIAELRRSRRLPELLRTTSHPGALADGVATWAEFDDDSRAAVLNAVDVGERVQLVLDWARNHVAELQVAESIRNDVTEGVDRQQREYLLRQQLEAIRKELGEGDGDVVAEYRTKLAELQPPEATFNTIAKEIDRLERTSSQSPEHGWIRTWLDRVFELPWNVRSDDNLDLANVRAVLDADHYGLDDVKTRIVEFMAVRKLRTDRGITAENGDGTAPLSRDCTNIRADQSTPDRSLDLGPLDRNFGTRARDVAHRHCRARLAPCCDGDRHHSRHPDGRDRGPDDVAVRIRTPPPAVPSCSRRRTGCGRDARRSPAACAP